MELGTILSALFLAAITCFFARKCIAVELLTVGAGAVALAGSILITRKVVDCGHYSTFLFFSVDALGAIIMLIISLVGLAVALYSVRFLREEVHLQVIGFKRVRQYYALLNLFLMAMLFAVTSSNPIFTWISIEATTLSTAFLISFYNKPGAMEAAWKYLIINSIGLLLGFFGTLLYFTSVIGMPESGFTTWNVLQSAAPHFNPAIAKIAFVFVLIGYGTKVGLAPMHTWLPDAHSRAPVPISALLSGVLLNVAFIAILRFKAITDLAIGQYFSQLLLTWFGFLSILVASLLILTLKNYKRLLAYSSIENMGFAAFGFGVGGMGVFAALFHMIYHALFKSSLFMLAGNVFLMYGSTSIAKVRGMITALPYTGVAFFVAFFAITATPPSGMFMTKITILTAGMQHHPAITIAVLLFVAVLFVGFFKHMGAMFFGEKPEEVKTGKTRVLLVAPPLVLLAIAIFLSLHIPSFIKELVASVTSHY
jgi:hydrogenase-4 component F